MIKDLRDRKNKIDKRTEISEEAFVADTASVVGDVSMGEGSSIWYGAVARGDMSYIRIGVKTNIQDNATLHVDTDLPCIIGNYVTVGHNAIIHGCEIGNNCLIGMGAIILNGAKIGDNSIIAAGALITENAVIPENSLVMGSPGKVRREIGEEEVETIRHNAIRYEELWRNEHV